MRDEWKQFAEEMRWSLENEAGATISDDEKRLIIDMADRIKELEGQVAGLLRQASDNHDALVRAEAAEAKLENLATALRVIRDDDDLWLEDMVETARAAKIELGERDDG